MNLLYSEMLRRSDPGQVAGLSRFFKTGPGQYGYGDQFLGIKVPVTREVVKACWKELDFNDLEECIACQYHEVRLAALLSLIQVFAHSKKDKARQQACIDFYLAHTDRINNWDLVDLSCYALLGEWLLDKDRSLLYRLARNGRTLWEQRIAMVSTMAFVRRGELDDTFAIADILLHHPHDLIHKAVGWLLREAGKRDKAALEAYLQGCDPHIATDPATPSKPSLPRYQSMPRTMLRYAIEKFPDNEREYLLSKHTR
ncbi:MAG: DNA alkylation repair protein [Bacteroidales bacterium]|nr:DNA alkylation repair protein [Bacteroidales bacterium]